ncbi:MAG: Gfo/Idh/MocA family oxidoreductase, partial [Candidatus Omnitrophica bacterium]|nr:Gfo/Idh/MocA family oxidoreductase [Candidatus Omnitrophota bacterium]
IGLVGCGGISKAHIQGYQKLTEGGCEEFEITVCCDVNEAVARERAEEIATFQGRRPAVVDDWEKVLSSKQVDGVDICLPHYLHHRVAIPFLDSGIHVLIEKPLGITLKAARKMVQVAKEKKVVLASAENVRRYLAARATAWAVKQAKWIGECQLVSVAHFSYGPFDYENSAFKWRGVKLLVGGGMIMDSGAHFADMMLYLFGEPEEVFCTMFTRDRRTIKNLPVLGEAQADVEDGWHAVIRYSGGPLVTWSYSRSFIGEPLITGVYHGSAGTVIDRSFVFHCFQTGGDIYLPNGRRISAEEQQTRYLLTLNDEEKRQLFPYGCTDGFGVEIWDFVDAVKKGRQPEIDGKLGLKAMALCESCFESATCGQPVKYQDVLEGKIDIYQTPINAFWKI